MLQDFKEICRHENVVWAVTMVAATLCEQRCDEPKPSPSLQSADIVLCQSHFAVCPVTTNLGINQFGNFVFFEITCCFDSQALN